MGGNPVGHSVGWLPGNDINDNNMMMKMMMTVQPMERMASAINTKKYTYKITISLDKGDGREFCPLFSWLVVK